MTATQEPFDRLPEFPLETFASIGPLERSERGPFLTIKPPRVEAGPAPAPVALGTSRSSSTTRHYFAWATYPRVVCHDPGPFVDGLQIAADAPGESGWDAPTNDLVALSGRVQHYRLSSLEGRTFPRPLWCTVTHGPWMAALSETESCIDGEANRWEFYLVESPEVAAAWYGAATDMPAVRSLSVVWGTMALAKQDPPTCCDGYFWCYKSGSCLRNGVPCKPPVQI
jgi:hypothetical protein